MSLKYLLNVALVLIHSSCYWFFISKNESLFVIYFLYICSRIPPAVQTGFLKALQTYAFL